MSLSHKLDHEYETTRKKIVKLKPNIHRRRQVRVKNWLKKLDEPTTVLTWQRLRNKYAKNLVFELGYSHFFQGTFVRETRNSGDQDFYYLQTILNF